MRLPARRLCLFVVLATALATQAGCGNGRKNAAAKAGTAQASQSGPAADQARRRLEATSTPGVRAEGGHAAIEMRFAVDHNPNPGEPFRVTVFVIAGDGAPTLKVDVPASEGLELAPVSVPTTFDRVEKGAIYTIPLDFTAAAVGVKIVTVVASEASPTGSDSATYSFPVIVGSSAIAAAAPPGAPSAQGNATGAPAPTAAAAPAKP